MRKSLIRKSKFLSLILRHKPDVVGLTLDRAGWVAIPDLLAALAAHGRAMTQAELLEVVETNPKQRFAIEGNRIRANQGHSIDVDLALTPTPPPDLLYHGSATRFAAQIAAEGLLKMGRHHVHLSEDVVTARQVGGRHGKPLIYVVDARGMVENGRLFYVTANRVWLTEHVPPAYLSIDGAAGQP